MVRSKKIYRPHRGTLTCLIFFVFFSTHLFSFQEINEGNTKDQNAPPQKIASPSVEYHLTVKTTLGDDRVVKGNVTLSVPEDLTVTHQRDGISYTKRILLTDIRGINFLKWESKFVRKNKEGEIYQFEPSDFRIILKDGSSLLTTTPNFPFFNSFTIQNANGKVTLFSLWMDLLRNDGTWYTGLPAPGLRFSSRCHNEAVKEIEFFDNTPGKIKE